MRLIKINVPEEKREKVLNVIYGIGVESVSAHKTERRRSDGETRNYAAIDLELSTPEAKRLEDALLSADFFDPEEITFAIRQGRSIVSDRSIRELTRPIAEPSTDLMQELWQFSHLTYGLAGRVFIASCLLAYGLIEEQFLLMIAGLLFLPLLPMLLAIGFGVLNAKWKLAAQGALTFAAAFVLLVAGGAAVGFLAAPPMRFDQFASLPISCLISSAVGVAAGLATVDDAGRRELIGLAAAAQIGIIPVWIGACLVLGAPSGTGEHVLWLRLLSFALNTSGIVVTSTLVYVLVGMNRRHLRKLK
jgi:hypothetical protein